MSTTGKPSDENAADLLESANTAAAHAADAVKTAAAKADDAIEASVEQIRELNEQAIKAARAAGQRALDAYQAALESVVDAERKLAGGSQLDWFTTLVSTQTEFTQRLGTIFVREQLNVPSSGPTPPGPSNPGIDLPPPPPRPSNPNSDM